MSTRSLIGKVEGNSIKAIYCHFDGYPQHVGEILKNNYNSENIVTKLIDLGDISSLEPQLEPREGQEHSFEHPVTGVTVAYHRDRGEDFFQRHYVDESEYLEELNDYEYIYLWRGDGWYIASHNDENFRLF